MKDKLYPEEGLKLVPLDGLAFLWDCEQQRIARGYHVEASLRPCAS